MGIIVPRTKLVRVFLNGTDRGIHVLVEQLGEMTLRFRRIMPGDIYRGEIAGKDRFVGMPELPTNLFPNQRLLGQDGDKQSLRRIRNQTTG